MNDPFDDWRFFADGNDFRPDPTRVRQTRQALLDIQKMLTRPSRKRDAMWEARLPGVYQIHALPAAELSLAIDIYPRVVERGGSGSHGVQERLLHLIAYTASADGVPFLRRTVDLRVSRDKFSKCRRLLATAGLAFALVRGQRTEATEALLELSTHPDEQVRAQALHYLGKAYQAVGGALPSGVVEALRHVAQADPILSARFEARAMLDRAGCALADEGLVAAVDFEVRPCAQPACVRIVRVGVKQTLFALHGVIQDAFEWDDDHLYSFFLGGVRDDGTYELKGLTPFGDPLEDGTSQDPSLSSLGLRVGDEMGYLFDYGDEHLFRVKVVTVHEKAPSGKLPSIIKRAGGSVRQYPNR